MGHQASYCLTAAFTGCPIFLDWASRVAADVVETVTRRRRGQRRRVAGRRGHRRLGELAGRPRPRLRAGTARGDRRRWAHAARRDPTGPDAACAGRGAGLGRGGHAATARLHGRCRVPADGPGRHRRQGRVRAPHAASAAADRRRRSSRGPATGADPEVAPPAAVAGQRRHRCRAADAAGPATDGDADGDTAAELAASMARTDLMVDGGTQPGPASRAAEPIDGEPMTTAPSSPPWSRGRPRVPMDAGAPASLGPQTRPAARPSGPREWEGARRFEAYAARTGSGDPAVRCSSPSVPCSWPWRCWSCSCCPACSGVVALRRPPRRPSAPGVAWSATARPRATPTAPGATPERPAPTPGSYKVKRGDTLSQHRPEVQRDRGAADLRQQDPQPELADARDRRSSSPSSRTSAPADQEAEEDTGLTADGTASRRRAALRLSRRARPPAPGPRPTAAPAPNRTGSSQGRPVSAAVSSMIRRASASSGIERRVEGDRDHASTVRSRAAIRSWRSMKAGSGAMGNVRSGRWSKSWSVSPGLWTMTIACGVAPWMRPRVTEEYAGWSREPWPSTSTQSPSCSPCSTMRSTVPCTKSDTTASTGAPQPSIMMPVWPVATNEVLTPASRGRPTQLQHHRHLANGAVRADRQDHPLPRGVATAHRRSSAGRSGGARPGA